MGATIIITIFIFILVLLTWPSGAQHRRRGSLGAILEASHSAAIISVGWQVGIWLFWKVRVLSTGDSCFPSLIVAQEH